MKKPAEYRRNAEECRKLAAKSFSGNESKRLLEMAEAWDEMALSREAMLAQQSELDRSSARGGSQTSRDTTTEA